MKDDDGEDACGSYAAATTTEHGMMTMTMRNNKGQ